jgi:hypothetical protein
VAFKSLKVYLTSSPILTPPKKHKNMMLYIAATSTVVSASIVVEGKKKGIYTKYNNRYTTPAKF